MDSDDSLTNAVNNVVQYHMNRSHEIVPDERDFLRPWRRRIRDIFNIHDEEMLSFLDKSVSEWEGPIKHRTFLQQIQALPPGASWLRENVASVVDASGIVVDIGLSLGIDIKYLQTTLHKCMEHYVDLIPKLFDCDDRLQKSLERLEDLKKRMNDFSELDSEDSDEKRTLQEAMLAFIGHCYKTWNIQQTYSEFCTLYAEFIAYRSVVPGLQESGQRSPTCTICTTERLTMCLIPCGHMFCNSCGQKQRASCYICRSTVQGRQRVYFSA